MAYDSALLKNTAVKLRPVKGSSFRTIALAWRKGSGRCEEFRELGEFLREHYRPPVVK
jgi:hypothetical protein